MYDIIIVGAGPAGLTSAIYALRANKNVLILEAKTYGGQIVKASCIDNYPGLPHISGVEFATKLYEQVKELGAEFKFEKVNNIIINNQIKKVVTNNSSYEAKAIILAMGAKARSLKLDSEELFIGKGVSYCATCDGMFFRDKDVAVVGGGDTALQDALYLSNICKSVYLIHRRDSFRGNASDLKKLKEKSNVQFVLNSNVIKLLGNTLLEKIVLSDNLGNISEIEVSGLFIAIGQLPESNEIISNLQLDSDGYIISQNELETNYNGIFVAGDIRSKSLRQLTTAVSDGSLAAVSACNYIDKL